MSCEQESNKVDFSLLSSEDKADGFSIVADSCHNIVLLKWSKPVAWFSAVVTEEVLRSFLEMVKDCERNTKGAMQSQAK